jgi:hypothetical protein
LRAVTATRLYRKSFSISVVPEAGAGVVQASITLPEPTLVTVRSVTLVGAALAVPTKQKPKKKKKMYFFMCGPPLILPQHKNRVHGTNSFKFVNTTV